ncbi:DUF3165 family protein [Streptococcus gordonii]|uniref:DUF3165 family protein n=1 Tax=Streptococcus gordonii TaxID=1302 RepID=UPI001CC04857|nr:DUF3165 family protein [Streptococcus gordonii]MBZ2133478.1 DUF3165 family protein [Streptococcus gordonii]MBZ2142015.1 DUF3165 family protein [Streptococcus gordonii]MBZ2144697.1 DUF3165 family protein [Streptococcus gordonii]MBZ2146950.1 DUF3165 family protein [Streptococcus gordonii]
MVYLIIGILILLYYLFAAPQSIKGTFNVLSVVLVLVLFIILLVLAAFRIFQLPAEYFVGFGLSVVTVLALRDINRLKPPKESKKNFDEE